MTASSVQDTTLKAFNAWYNQLPMRKPAGGAARGTVGAALVVLERLKETFNLDLDSHRAVGKSQIKGASGAVVARILARFGETRPFLKEGGRTNRGGPGDIAKMLEALRASKLDTLPTKQRDEILNELQEILVNKVREFHNKQRLKIVYKPSSSTWQLIHDLLTVARQNGKEGAVAQYLVGAKLQLRFPTIQIENKSYSTADEQLGRPGDFYIGDTAFHVTVAPMQGVYDKCKVNIEQGLRVFLLVPDQRLLGARQNIETLLTGQVAVESIESFVAQNIEELSAFSKGKLPAGVRNLLESYNQRVDNIESDKSMLVEIPRNLWD